MLCETEGEWRPDPNIFSCIPVSAAAAAVNYKGTKPIFVNGLITYFIRGNLVFSNGPRSLPRKTFDCIILDNCVFDSLIFVDDLLVKVLRRFATCLIVNEENGREKLVSSSPIIFLNNLKSIPDSLFVADSPLLSCEFDSFTFKLEYCVILH